MESHVRPGHPLFVVLVISLFSAAGIIHGQQPTGELRLAVEDSSGERMQASGRIDGRAFQTDPQGHSDFQNLASGRHRLEVSKPGFATEVVSVEVTPGSPVSRTVTLGPAGTSSSRKWRWSRFPTKRARSLNLLL